MNLSTSTAYAIHRAKRASITVMAFLTAFVLITSLHPVASFMPSFTQTAEAQSQHALLPALSGNQRGARVPRNTALAFIENAGQFDERVDFQLRSGNMTLFLTNDALWITLTDPSPQADVTVKTGVHDSANTGSESCRQVNLKLSFVGANAHPLLEPFDGLDTRISFFHGNDPAQWHTGVRTWGGVRYVDLYPGMDLEITGQEGQLALRLVVREHLPLQDVRLRVEGAELVALEGDYLRLDTPLGGVTLPLLTVEGTVPEVEPAILVADGAYDVSTPFASTSLPAIKTWSASTSALQYSTYLGGTCEDRGYDIAVDETGNVYVTGQIASADFPTTPGAYDTSNNDDPPGCQISDFVGEAFITKLSADGSTILYSTYLGGNSADAGQGIVVDSLGNVYLAGNTSSTDFPTTSGALDADLSGGRDAFVAKLNAAGDDLIYSTYLGGYSWEYGLDIAVDAQGNAYVTGFTHGGFPTTPGTIQPTSGGSIDPFVVKLNQDGSGLVYSTYLGGSSSDGGESLVVDGMGNAYLTGQTQSTDFPTANALQPAKAGGTSDAFVAKLNADGSDLVYSTYLGGSDGGGGESGYGIVIDSAGNAYVAGATDAVDFPTVGPLQPAYGGGELDAFLLKINEDGSALEYSTYYGGSGLDRGLGVGIDRTNSAYITGYTSSTDLVTVNPLQAANAGGYDAFLARVSRAGRAWLFSSYLGGSGDENLYNPGQGDAGLAVHSTGKVYITGLTSSTDFPTTAGALDTTFTGGDSDIFVTSLDFGPANRRFLPLIFEQ